MRVLDPTLDATLTNLGSTETDKATLIGFLEAQVAAASGRVSGIDNSIADLQRQRETQAADVARLTIMLQNLTVETK